MVEGRTSSCWDWMRRVLFVATAAVAGVLVFATNPVACKGVASGDGVVRVCEPLGVTSLAALWFALLLAVLAFPDLSELEFLGLVKLKGRVEEAANEARDARKAVEELQVSVNQIAWSSSHATASPTVNFYGNQSEILRTSELSGLLRDPTTGSLDTLAGEDTDGSGAMALSLVLTGILSLLPAEWNGATVVGILPSVGLSWAAGRELDAALLDAFADAAPRILAGESDTLDVTEDLLTGIGEVVVIPFDGADGIASMVVVVLPPGVTADPQSDGIADLEVLAAGFARASLAVLADGAPRPAAGELIVIANSGT